MNKRTIILIVITSLFVSCPWEEETLCSDASNPNQCRLRTLFFFLPRPQCRLDSTSFANQIERSLPSGDWKRFLVAKEGLSKSYWIVFGSSSGQSRLLFSDNWGETWEDIILPNNLTWVDVNLYESWVGMISAGPNGRFFELNLSSKEKVWKEVPGIPRGNWTSILPHSFGFDDKRRYLLFEFKSNRMLYLEPNENWVRVIQIPVNFSIGFADIDSGSSGIMKAMDIIFPSVDSQNQNLLQLRPRGRGQVPEVIQIRNPAPQKTWIGGSLANKIFFNTEQINNVMTGYRTPIEGISEEPEISFSTLNTLNLKNAFPIFSSLNRNWVTNVPIFLVETNSEKPIRIFYRDIYTPNPEASWEDPIKTLGIQNFPVQDWVAGNVSDYRTESPYLFLLSKGITSSVMILPLTCPQW